LIICSGLWLQGLESDIQAQTQATVTVSSVEAPKDKVVTVTVSVEGVPTPGLSDFQGKLIYNPTVARVEGIKGLSGYNIFAFHIDNSNGEVRFIGAKVSGQLITEGEFLQFSIRAVGDPQDQSLLELTFSSFNTPDGGISHTVHNGQLTVTSGELQADFTFSPTQPQVGQVVRFTDKSVSRKGTVNSWRWDFGDGATSTAQNPTHSYSRSGKYNVKLTVKDDQGNSDSITKEITVGTGAPPSPISAHVFPNPARTKATFKYDLPGDTTRATLWVFSLDGALVFSEDLDVEAQQFAWNLRDQAGRNLLSGAYYYRISALTSGGVRHSPVGRLVIRR